MIPASWKSLGNTALQQAAHVTVSIKSGMRPSSNVIRSGQRFYSNNTNIHTPLCTNSVRKTLYSANHNNGTHQTRLATLHPSSAILRPSIAPSRMAPMIRRGFVDNASSKAATSTSTTLSKGQETGAVATKQSSGLMDKIKQLIKKYGYTGVAVYLGISMIDLAATFVIVKAAGMDKIEQAQDWVVDHIGGYFGYKRHDHKSQDTAGDLDKVDDEQVGAIYNKASGLWSVFVIAYGIHKLLVPLRVVATSMVTPPLVKWLVKKGWIKEVAKKGPAVKSGTTVTTSTAPTKP
ncbi:hypothetical protein EDD11_006820 [Mortierella claussenii]|nr:hypothetical protein EDD11_006820 [Mortierella claussenii]